MWSVGLEMRSPVSDAAPPVSTPSATQAHEKFSPKWVVLGLRCATARERQNTSNEKGKGEQQRKGYILQLKQGDGYGTVRCLRTHLTKLQAAHRK